MKLFCTLNGLFCSGKPGLSILQSGNICQKANSPMHLQAGQDILVSKQDRDSIQLTTLLFHGLPPFNYPPLPHPSNSARCWNLEHLACLETLQIVTCPWPFTRVPNFAGKQCNQKERCCGQTWALQVREHDPAVDVDYLLLALRLAVRDGFANCTGLSATQIFGRCGV